VARQLSKLVDGQSRSRYFSFALHPPKSPFEIFLLEVICDGVNSSDNSDHFAAGHSSAVAAQPELGIRTERRDWSVVANRTDSGVAEDYLENHLSPGALGSEVSGSDARWATHA
jgi:hypothetical protein